MKPRTASRPVAVARKQLAKMTKLAQTLPPRQRATLRKVLREMSETLVEIKQRNDELAGRCRALSRGVRADRTVRREAKAAGPFQERLLALGEAATQLSAAPTFDEVCRRAVELGRRLGFDRLAIWFRGEQPGFVEGSFGTDERGKTRYKRAQQGSRRRPAWIQQVLTGKKKTIIAHNTSLYDHRGHVVGKGSVVAAGIWDGKEVIGYISADNLFSQKPMGEEDRKLLGIYASCVRYFCSVKRTDQALRESEQRYRCLFEDSPIAVSDTDLSRVKEYIDRLRKKGVKDFAAYFDQHPQAMAECAAMAKKVEANKAFLELYQAKSLKAFREGLGGILAKESFEVFKKELLAIAEGKTVFESDAIRQTLKGEKKHIRLKWSVAPGFEDTYAKVLVSVVDITEHKRAEEAYCALVDHSLQGLVILQDNRIVFANKAVTERSGYSTEELLGMTAERIRQKVHPGDQAFVWARYRDRLEGKAVPERYEFRIFRRDGSVCWVEISARSIEYRGKPATQATLVDITERKRAEQALEQERERMSLILSSLGTGLSLLNPDYTIAWVNQKTRQMFPKGNPVGQVCWVFYESRREPCETCAARQAFETGMLAETERENPFNGRWYHIVSEPIKDAMGQVVNVLEAVADITERKRAEQELRESRSRLQELFDEAPVGYHEVDRKGNIVRVNCTELEMLGYTAEEMIGHSIWEFVMEQDVSRRAFAAKIAGKAPIDQPFERTYRKKDGTTLPVLIKDRLLRDADGSVTGVRSTIQDITERKRAEQALRESEEKYKHIAENPIDGVGMIQEGMLIYVNDAYCEMLGYGKEELLGQSLLTVVAAEDRRMVAERVALRLEGKRAPSHYVFQAVRKDGSPIFAEVAISEPFPYRNKPTVLAVLRDVTERKRSEEQLLAYQEQLRSLASELALAEERERRRIAEDLHDRIGQSLAVLKMQMGALGTAVPPEAFAPLLEQMRALIDRTILDTRSLTFELSPPILYELGLEPAVEWLAEQTQQLHGIVARFKDDGQLKPLDDQVRMLLFRAVRELLLNVAKHAHAKHVKVAIRRDNNEIRIDVEDDGAGFEVGEMELRARREGAFGLFSIRERLKHLGGRLEIQSSPGRGTRATLIAPLGVRDEPKRVGIQ